jgi:hypothetical protein
MSPGNPPVVMSSIVVPDRTSPHYRKDSHNSPPAGSRYPSTKTLPTPSKTIRRRFNRPAQNVTEQENFADVISRSFAKSTFDTQERFYLPEPSIKGRPADPPVTGLVIRGSVDQEFKRATIYGNYKEQGLDDVIDWVVAEASKVFVITVQCHLKPENLLLSMVNFYETFFNDEVLPINDPRALDAVSKRPPRSEAFSSDIWTDQRHDEFFQFQWTCLAPVFVEDQYEYDLLSQYILPFTRVLDMDPRGGSFSSVFKVIVHPDHQQRHSSIEVSLWSIHP